MTLIPLAVGLAAFVATILIHAVAVRATVGVVRYETRPGQSGRGFWADVAIVALAATLALVAHLVEMTVWAAIFVACGEFSGFAPAYYHSASNYTTLGYGDLVMSPSWRLLGPLEAANGMLMFGVSTAMIFAVIRQLIQAQFPDLGE